MLSNLTNKVTSFLSRYSSFVAIVKAVMHVSTAFEKEHSRSFLGNMMMDVVEDMDASEFLSGNSPQTCQCDIHVAGLFLQ